jgi:hypothetical protein
MPKIVQTNWFALGVLAIAVVLFFFRQFQYPAFNLIDDGYSLLVTHELKANYSIQNWQKTLIDQELAKGRLRPGYYLYYFVVSQIGGDQPMTYWLFQAASLFGLLALIYYFLRAETKNQQLSLAASLAPLVFPSLLENFYRLGPAESRQLLWLLLSALFLVRTLKNQPPKIYTSVLTLLFYLLALFTKETSLLALPAFLALILVNWLVEWKKLKHSPAIHHQLALSLTLLLATCVFLFLIPSGQGYSSGLSFDFNAAKANLFYVRAAFPEFHWLLVTGALVFVRRLIENREKLNVVGKTFILSTFFLILSVVYLFFPLFWQHQLERYYLLGQVFAWIFFIIEAHFLYQEYLTKKLKIRSLIFSGLLLVLISSVIFLPSKLSLKNLAIRFHINRQVWYEQYQYSYALITYLQNNVQPGTSLYVAFNDYEVIYEIGLFASYFFEKEILLLSENNEVVQNFGGIYQLTSSSTHDFAQSQTPSLLIIKINPPENSMPLWPSDDSLRDKSQVWSIVSNKLAN